MSDDRKHYVAYMVSPIWDEIGNGRRIIDYDDIDLYSAVDELERRSDLGWAVAEVHRRDRKPDPNSRALKRYRFIVSADGGVITYHRGKYSTRITESSIDESAAAGMIINPADAKDMLAKAMEEDDDV